MLSWFCNQHCPTPSNSCSDAQAIKYLQVLQALSSTAGLPLATIIQLAASKELNGRVSESGTDGLCFSKLPDDNVNYIT